MIKLYRTTQAAFFFLLFFSLQSSVSAWNPLKKIKNAADKVGGVGKKAFKGTVKIGKKTIEISKDGAKLVEKGAKYSAKWVKKSAKELKRQGEKAWKKLSSFAQKKIADKAIEVARKLFEDKIKVKLLTNLKKGWSRYSGMSKERIWTRFLKTAREQGLKRPADLKRTFNGLMKQYKLTKSYGKTVAAAIPLAVALSVLQPFLKCMPYSGQNKRLCLHKYTGDALRGLTYKIAYAFVKAALDIQFFEPASHAVAGVVSAILASGTLGIGLVAYPAVYLASSIALNVITDIISVKWVIPEYEKITERTGYLSLCHRTVEPLIRQLPDSWMVCNYPSSSYCKNVLPREDYPIGHGGNTGSHSGNTNAGHAQPSAGAVVQLNAGPLFSHNHAQQVCPQVCSRASRMWNGGWKTIHSRMSVCDCAPQPNCPEIRDGMLIRPQNDPKVYHIERGLKRHVVSGAVMGQCGFSWGAIKVIHPFCAQRIPTGSSLHGCSKAPNCPAIHDGMLIRPQNDPKVYHIEQGRKRHVVSGAVMGQCGFSWGAIKVIPPLCAYTIPLGAPLYGCGSANAPQQFTDMKMTDADHSCPPGYRHPTYQETVQHRERLCKVIGQWSAIRIAGGGSMDGPGYGCNSRQHDARKLGGSLCVR